MVVITNYLPTWKHLVAVTMAGFGLLAPPADAEELGSCVVDKSSTSAAVVCAIAPGTGLKLVTITVKTGTPDGTGPATMIINNPNADPVNEVLDLDEVNLVIEDDFAYGIWFEDINFDGYVDFAVTEFIPAAPNVPHLFWLFNPASWKYEANESLRQITSPSIDHERKRLRSAWRGSCCNHGVTVYEWRGDFVVRIRDAECELVAKAGAEIIRFSEWTASAGIGDSAEIASYDDCLARLEDIH